MNVRKIIHDVYRRERTVPFKWGTADCVLFCADCALEITGRDPLSHFRGRYDSEISAKRVLLEHGWKSLGDGAATIFPEIPVCEARSGDWAFVVNPDGTESLGVVMGAEIVARTVDGLGLTALTAASRAYRVTA